MKLYKTTITVISEYDPTFKVEASDLCRDAEQGESYCTGQETVEIDSSELEQGVQEFFNCMVEEE